MIIACAVSPFGTLEGISLIGDFSANMLGLKSFVRTRGVVVVVDNIHLKFTFIKNDSNILPSAIALSFEKCQIDRKLL